MGSSPAGLDLTNLNPNAELEELAEQVLTQGGGAERWLPKVQTEQEALKGELQAIGLWGSQSG